MHAPSDWNSSPVGSPVLSPDGPRLLLVDDDSELLAVMGAALASAGFRIDAAGSAEEGLRRFRDGRPDAALVDVNLPGLDGFAFLERARALAPQVPILMLSGHGGLDDAARAVAAGASNYLVKPIDGAGIAEALRLALRNVSVQADLVTAPPADTSAPADRLLGTSPAMQRLRQLITEIGPTRCAVLVQGETGTGKELVARALHDASGRRGPFVAVNCAALPEGLIESALFGHERGAFTGALRREIGAFERADGGTLLLDEITEMRPDLQAKLLRVLQEGEVLRVGGTQPVPVDLRIVATTNRDPEQAVRSGVLREDLFYRLDVVRVRLPALRERREDIPTLARALLADAAAEFGRPLPSMNAAALRALQHYDWPGNVRQLHHVLQRALLFARGGGIAPAHLVFPDAPTASAAPSVGPQAADASGARRPAASMPASAPAASALPTLDLRALEELAIAAALRATDGNRSHAARLLGLNVRSLRRKLNDRDDA